MEIKDKPTHIRYWMLKENNEPEEIFGSLTWAGNPRSHVRIDATEEGNVTISTVFIGLGDVFTGRPFFETMIFGGRLDLYQERCGTYAQALEQHKLAVELHKAMPKRRIKEGD